MRSARIFDIPYVIFIEQLSGFIIGRIFADKRIEWAVAVNTDKTFEHYGKVLRGIERTSHQRKVRILHKVILSIQVYYEHDYL